MVEDAGGARFHVHEFKCRRMLSRTSRFELDSGEAARRVDERTIPPEGVVPSTGRHPPEAPRLPPGANTNPEVQTIPTATGPTI